MDPSLLTKPAFWNDASPVFMGDFPFKPPQDSRLAGHVMFATSGSSGEPKWIALSKQALLASAESVNRHLGVTPASRWGLALPVHHVGGFGVAARAHAAGCGFSCFSPPWNAAKFRDWLAAEKTTHTSLVPTQVHDLVAGGHHAPASLDAIVVGGGCLDVETGRAARSLGWPVLASYGMTEAASQVATQGPEDLATPYQHAPIPILPHWLVRTDNDDRVWLHGPALFSGTILRADGPWIYQERAEGWFACSDRGRIQDGMLTPLGRFDLTVKVLGELVDLAEIERELSRIAGSALAPDAFAVVAVRDARAEHALVPVFDSSVPEDSANAALEIYQAGTPGPRRLQKPVFITQLPKSPLGKVMRLDLKQIVTSLRPES